MFAAIRRPAGPDVSAAAAILEATPFIGGSKD